MGLDLGDRYTHVCELDARGTVVKRHRVATTRKALGRFASRLEPRRVVLEVGTHSPWVVRLFVRAGHETLLANPRRVPVISASLRKTDKHDAEMLARLARVDPKLLVPIVPRDERVQRDRAIVRSREALVHTRTRLVTHVRTVIKSAGERLPACSTAAFARRVESQLPDDLRPALAPLLEVIAELTVKIKQYDRKIATLSKTRYPETQLLRQVAGVGPISALMFVLTIGDPARFPKPRALGAYLGLVPGQRESGRGRPQLPITKAGDGLMRRLLVQNAQYILGPFGPDTSLRRWGLTLAARGGKAAKKRAVIAVARKLAGVLLALWKTAEVYEPLRGSPDSQVPNDEAPNDEAANDEAAA